MSIFATLIRMRLSELVKATIVSYGILAEFGQYFDSDLIQELVRVNYKLIACQP